MDPDSMGLGITVVVGAIIILSTLISVAIPIAMIYFIRKAMSGGIGQQIVPTQLVYQQPYPMAPMPMVPPMPPPPPQIKKCVCRSCGASKAQQAKTAFIYCDYCGALVDWDFRIAITTAGSARPGPEYQRLEAEVAPLLAYALAQGDRHSYRATLLRLINQHMDSCRASYSPRLGDPAYRAAQLEFQVNSILETDFDPPTRALKANMEQAITGLQRYPRPGQPMGVEPQSFRRMFAACMAHHARFMDVVRPFIPQHPDRPSFELISAIQTSIFAQAWLRHLEKHDQDWLIAQLRLEGEYIPYQPVATNERHCGGCGASLAVVQGAYRVVCELCGYTNDVQRPELACTSCTAPLSIPLGVARFPCPHCRVDLRVD